jgi:hypothetical protein
LYEDEYFLVAFNNRVDLVHDFTRDLAGLIGRLTFVEAVQDGR